MKTQITKKELLHQKAVLESLNDQLSSELEYVDRLMKLVGFTNGIETVKASAHELVRMEEENNEDEQAA